MKEKHVTTITCAIIVGITGIVSSLVTKNLTEINYTTVVQVDGKETVLTVSGIHDMADENERLKEEILVCRNQMSDKEFDYEKKLEELENENGELKGKLGVANGELEDVPAIEYKNFGLSIDGEEKQVNKDRSFVSINGREYYSKDFIENLLPADRNTIQKGDVLYVGKVVKEKSNLFHRQVIEQSNGIDIGTNVKDTYGNLHNDAVIFFYNNANITFNANREYSKMKFTVAVKDEEGGGGEIQIETEEGVIHTTKELTSMTEPYEIDIPINQASKITIKYLGSDYEYAIIADAVLYNEE